MTHSSAYAAWQASFRWRVPTAFNIATGILERHDPNRLALIDARDDAPTREYGYGELDLLSNRLANMLFRRGIALEDRVAVLMPQRAEVAIAHFAIYKTGAIAVPLFATFGAEALRFRMKDAGVRFVVADAAGAERLMALGGDLPALEAIFDVDSASFARELQEAVSWCAHESTHAEDPALILYTSGTTGAPKGAVHAQRVLLGHLPGVEMTHEGFPQDGDRCWTPADWACVGGLLGVLLPSLYCGVPVVAGPGGKFAPERVAAFMARHRIKNVFMPPTALRSMRQAEPDLADVRLRTLASGGERLGDELVGWARDAFGCAVNEFYGQTEANLVVSGMASAFPRRGGAIGRAVPGHNVAVVDDAGAVKPWDEPGHLAVHHPDPVMFLGYWNNPEATRAKYRGDWLITGDTGRMDPEGYVTFLGRDDDLINAAGWRIGPAELEAVIGEHPEVAQVAVVGVPDPARGEAVVACVVPRRAGAGGEVLARELHLRAREAVGPHAAPREIVFRESLPLTATGKVLRRDLRAMLAADRGG
ncbi:MAG: AMP-binding protein [Alphaproteobacteria bacterium]